MRKFCALIMLLLIFAMTSCLDSTPEAVSSLPLPSEATESTAVPTPTPTPSPSAEELEEAAVNAILDGMTLEEMVSQMFMLRFSSGGGYFTSADEDMISFVQRNMPGGYVLFTDNITTVSQTREMVDAIMANSATPPFIGIDEEGGLVSRLASAGLDGYEAQPAAAVIGESGDSEQAYNVASTIGAALKSIGVNLDFAPVADVLTNPENTVIGNRSFGSDANLVADMVARSIDGLHDNGIMAAAKHFPGHGGTSGDSHDGSVYIDYDEQHLSEVEYVPFKRAISEGSEFILVGHILVPNADDSGLPASLSPYFVTDVLRGELAYDGLIATDAMDMGAVAENYAPGEASVLAIKAGIDVVLIPDDYVAALDAVQAAIDSGEISEARIRESAYRIMRAKLRAGLLNPSA